MRSAVRGWASQLGLLPRLPGEEALCDDEKIATKTIDDDLLRDAVQARRYLNSLVDGSSFQDGDSLQVISPPLKSPSAKTCVWSLFMFVSAHMGLVWATRSPWFSFLHASCFLVDPSAPRRCSHRRVKRCTRWTSTGGSTSSS